MPPVRLRLRHASELPRAPHTGVCGAVLGSLLSDLDRLRGTQRRRIGDVVAVPVESDGGGVCLTCPRLHRPNPRPNPVLKLVQDLHVRIIHAATGELLRELDIDPDRDYQPTGRTRYPNKRQQAEP